MNGYISRLIEAARARLASDKARRFAPILALLLPIAIAAALILGGGTDSEAAGPAPGADQFTAKQREAIDAMIRAYILENPEIIPEAINRMQEREVEKLLASNREEIETPFAGAWAGNPKGDVVLVEFFDYACPYCRISAPDVKRLLKEDGNLKVVYRDFPVLSPASEEAALASLSAAKQGRYAAFYERMFGSEGRVTHERVVSTVRAAGLNEYQTARDMQSSALKAEIKKNLDLGRALGLTGTPSYIIGNQILSGAVGYDQLKQAVEKARAAKQS